MTLLEQEANGLNVANDRTFLIEGENRMFGVFGRATHYTALADNRGLRVVGTLGLHANSYEYSYDTSSSPYLPPDQSIRQSGDNGVVSAGLSVQYEHGLTERTWLTAEFGYEGYYGVMNGFDTFIDPHGTSGSASIDRDHIGSLHLTIGVAHRF